MATTTDVFSELIRATDEVGKLSPWERSRPMACGARTIRELRLVTGIRPGTARRLHNVDVAALKSEKGDEEAQMVLLEMADIIRTRKIVLDAPERGGAH